RRRPAEGDPEEEQDAEAGEREAGNHQELGCAGGKLTHLDSGPQLIVGAVGSGGMGGSRFGLGTLAPCKIVLIKGFPPATPLARYVPLQEIRIRLRPIGPAGSSRLKVALV